MNKYFLLICTLLLQPGCGDEYAGEVYDGYAPDQAGDRRSAVVAPTDRPRPSASGARQPSDPAGGDIKMHPFHDPQSGLVSVTMPLPKEWNVLRQHAPGEPSITGPNGLKIYEFPPQSFLYTNDPQMQQMYAQSGQRLRPMPDFDTLIQQDVVPWAAQQGLKLLRTFSVPEVQRIDQWYQQQLFQSVPSQKQQAAIGSDWASADGDQFFLLMHIGQSSGAGLQTWYYYSNGLQAAASHYPTAKKQLIYALANAQYNPAQIQAYNQREAQKSGQSWAAHNQRMRSNQASFEASQRAIVGANNAVNDSIMQGWRDRNAMTDRGQERYVDAISERSTMVNPSSGQAWEVDAGSNNYWMNSNGEYFGTEEYNYDPNTDPGMYDQDWQQLEEAQY
jgi:hypothetical protein